MWKPQPSFWEKQSLYRCDVLVVGAGLTGLHAALNIKKLNDQMDVKVVDRAPYSAGASTRNAGFVCFADPTELLDDVSNMGQEEAVYLCQLRYDGLQQLKSVIAPNRIGWTNDFAGEVFWDQTRFEPILQQLNVMNQWMNDSLGLENTFIATEFNGMPAIQNRYEAGLNTGFLIRELRRECRKLDIPVIGGVEVKDFRFEGPAGLVRTSTGTWNVKQLVIATNALFSTPFETVQPVRNVVLVSKPMSHPWKGTFSAEGGFYYWRNITDSQGGNRLLLGGGRHQFPESEHTDEFGVPAKVVAHLEELARNQLKVRSFETDMMWSGILGIGTEGKGLPIIKEEQPGVFYGVRMGGMGVALSAGVGKKLGELVVSRAS